VFGQASRVMRIGNGRQEVFQYARALFETLDREIPGVIGVRDAGPSAAGTPFHINTTQSAIDAFQTSYGVEVREGSDTMSLTAALIGRDTEAGSTTLGQTGNVAHVAYWLSPDTFILNRYESYHFENVAVGQGWEFAMHVLEFQLGVLDRNTSEVGFERKDWDSRATIPTGARQGVPDAVQVTLKITDIDHIDLYRFDATNRCSALKPGVRARDDQVMQEFKHVVRTQESQ
ncbi:MAG TPA: hypothetical protein VMX57_00270, partial [Planctomycetota bacterium]|nr:hypothetical protein [Planctomycetota bacterium]